MLLFNAHPSGDASNHREWDYHTLIVNSYIFNPIKARNFRFMTGLPQSLRRHAR